MMQILLNFRAKSKVLGLNKQNLRSKITIIGQLGEMIQQFLFKLNSQMMLEEIIFWISTICVVLL